MNDTDPRIKEAESRIEQSNAYDINPGDMAENIVATIETGMDLQTLEKYIYDRMWYRRGA